MLAAHCQECHGPEKHKGGLRLDGRGAMLKGGETGAVVVPGKPNESPLIEAIRYEGDVQMPPKGKLKDEEIAALTNWVKRGAPWPEARPGLSTRTAPKPAATKSISEATHPVALSAKDRAFWSFQPVQNPAAAAGQGQGLGPFVDRPVHPRQARREWAHARAAG